MKCITLILFICCAWSARAEEVKSILLVAGKPSHGPGEHEFHAGADVLARALNDSGLSLNVSVQYDTWPESSALERIDALVVYSDGNEAHVALGNEASLLALSNRGIGIVFLHYAVDGMPGLLDETLIKVIGGHYDDEKSSNPEWVMKDPVMAEHPITRGVKPYELHDEWYYNLKFGEVTPIFQAKPPEEEEVKTLAWTFGKNAFGFTGGHFHRSWIQPDYRKMILNAVVWSAGLEVPENGVESVDPVILKNKSLLHAIAKGDPDDVRNHLLMGADVNEKNKQGWAPLHFASVRGKTECAEVLIKQGAELDPRTGTEKTPLHFTADRGFLELAMVLVSNGADIHAQDDEGWTPLHYAAEKDHVDVAAFLIESGAEINFQSVRGGTALHEASASASADMINLLLEHGADKNIAATNGYIPLDYAIELGNEAAEALLK